MDYIEQLNWFVVFVAATTGFLTGALWYSKSMLGKVWMKTVGLKDKDVKKANMTVTMGGAFIGLFILAAALEITFDVFALSGAESGILFGAMVAGGFIVPLRLMHSLFELKAPQYILITGVGDVVMLGVMGLVIGLL